MIKIDIKGLKDGLHDIEIIEPVESVANMLDEFFGDIEIKGELRIFGNYFSFHGKAICNIILVCDRTLKEFENKIEAEISVSFQANSSRIHLSEQNDVDSERMISNEDDYINITKDVCEELVLNIPMKRIAPDVENKEFGEIYPEYEVKTKRKDMDEDEIEDRWSALKNIKIN